MACDAWAPPGRATPFAGSRRSLTPRVEWLEMHSDRIISLSLAFPLRCGFGAAHVAKQTRNRHETDTNRRVKLSPCLAYKADNGLVTG